MMQGFWQGGWRGGVLRIVVEPGAGAAVRPVARAGFPVVLLLLALVALADWSVWQPDMPRLSLAVLVLVIALVAQVLLGWQWSRRAALIGWAGLVAGLLPLVEEVQALSLLMALLGLLHGVGWMVAGSGSAAAWTAALRFIANGPVQPMHDGVAFVNSAGHWRAMPGGFGGLLSDWGLPVALGTVFVGLLVLANPMFEGWLEALGQWSPMLDFDPDRVMFWVLMAALVWPFLRLTVLRERLTAPLKGRAMLSLVPVAVVNERSVLRALVMFNLIFAVQSLLDLAYLWGGVTLPEGMTDARYAHRGAYPLLATALLAGGFALLAQPFLAGRPGLRVLLYLWVAQTVLLVVSSILRLDLYVGAYGLTHLRFAAFIWMGLVAAGLCLMLVQMMLRRGVGWLYVRSAGMGLVTLYAVCFVNVTGLVAGHNLARPELVIDNDYLCAMGDGALPAIRVWEQAHRLAPCPGYPPVAVPADWREWGFRNARLRHSLSAVYAGRGAVWLPQY